MWTTSGLRNLLPATSTNNELNTELVLNLVEIGCKSYGMEFFMNNEACSYFPAPIAAGFVQQADG